MTNNTEIYWVANGVSLHTLAWSVETRAGRMASPAKRGEDVLLPYRSGRIPIRKFRESRTLSLPMWVGPFDQDGTADPTMSKKAKTEQNWNYLMEKLDVDGQFGVVKQWYDNGEVKFATQWAELLDPPDITVSSRNIWRFVLELHMADPWFYGDPIIVPPENIDSFVVEGSSSTDKVTIQMPNGRITTPNGNWIQYNGTGLVDIDCHKAEAKKGSAFVNGLIDRNPKFPEWMTLQPGPNAITGSATITYNPAYK